MESRGRWLKLTRQTIGKGRMNFRGADIHWGIVEVHVHVLILKIDLGKLGLGLDAWWHFLDTLVAWVAARIHLLTRRRWTFTLTTEFKCLVVVTYVSMVCWCVTEGDGQVVD